MWCLYQDQVWRQLVRINANVQRNKKADCHFILRFTNISAKTRRNNENINKLFIFYFEIDINTLDGLFLKICLWKMAALNFSVMVSASTEIRSSDIYLLWQISKYTFRGKWAFYSIQSSLSFFVHSMTYRAFVILCATDGF